MNPTGSVPTAFGITDADVLRIVFEVDLPNWQAPLNYSYFHAYLFPENSGPGPDKNIYYAGPYPPPTASGAQTVGLEPGVTAGSRLLPVPNLPAGFGLFKLQFYAMDASWDFAIQRCDDSGAPDF